MRQLDPVTIPEQTAPSTPAAGFVIVYAGADHKLHTKDSTGADELVAYPAAARLYAAANFR